MTKNEYIQLFDQYVRATQDSLENIHSTSPEESRAYYLGVKWAYQNVVTLLTNEELAKKFYARYVK